MIENSEHIETGHTEQSASSVYSEGNPAVEQAEKKVFGNNYQRIETVHRFADTHAWVFPISAIGVLAIVVCIMFVLRRSMRRRHADN